MAERLSRNDETLLYGYEMHVQRYRFAAQWVRGKTVLDAGCGIGYGSSLLARAGAKSVLGVDLSQEALSQAEKHYRRDGAVRFVRADLEALDGAVPGPVDAVVNLENLEHLRHPERFLGQLRQLLVPGGVFVTSTPNGLMTTYDAHGHIANEFHVKEFTREEFVELLKPHFSTVELFGQWETNDRKLRLAEERHLFEQACDAYFNPAARVGRLIRRAFGKRVAGPPEFRAGGATYSWDHVIEPLDGPWPFEWEPVVLLAVCR
jgi:SAM-dependent methyltransferase